MDWYLLRTKPREELRAKIHLENQSFQTYLPMLNRQRKGKEPLFPGYIFLAPPNFEMPLHTIRSTRGVMNFVRFGMEFATVPPELIEDIQLIENQHQNVPMFLPGQTVLCKQGPFAGLEAVFQMDDGENRCIILLTILNAQRQITVSQDDLQVI